MGAVHGIEPQAHIRLLPLIPSQAETSVRLTHILLTGCEAAGIQARVSPKAVPFGEPPAKARDLPGFFLAPSSALGYL